MTSTSTRPDGPSSAQPAPAAPADVLDDRAAARMPSPRAASEPAAPAGPVAPGTHPVELERLARQEQTHDGCVPLNVQTLIWILRAYNAVNSAQTEELRPLGLSPSAFNVLMALHNSAEHRLEPCVISERLLVSRPSVTGLLDTLQSKGLILRLPHPADRRRLLIELTDEGMGLLEEHFATHYTEQERLLAGLTPDERATLVGLLRRIEGATPAGLAADD